MISKSPSSSFLKSRDHLVEMILWIEWLDLIEQPLGQFMAGHDRKGGNVVNRFFGIEFGALAARPIENVDDLTI